MTYEEKVEEAKKMVEPYAAHIFSDEDELVVTFPSEEMAHEWEKKLEGICLVGKLYNTCLTYYAGGPLENWMPNAATIIKDWMVKHG